MGEGLVSRRFLLSAMKLDGWNLTTLPAVTPAMLADGNRWAGHKNGAQGQKGSKTLASARKSWRRLRSPISRVPVAPYLYARQMTQALTAAIQNEASFDVLLLHLSQPDLEPLARFSRRVTTPIVLRAPGPLAYQADHVFHRYMSRRDRQNELELYGRAAAISVISQAMKNLIAGMGVDPDKIHVLPNGVDFAQFHPENADGQRVRQAHQIGDRPVVGYVGGFWPGNDMDTLLRAWQRVEAARPDALLLLVGDGPGLAQAQRLADELALQNCLWAGRVPHDAVPDYLAAMDIGVAPYIPAAVAFVSPLKVIEYTVMGLPVVAAAGGQIGELVQDGVTGCTYPPGEAAPLAEAVLDLLAAPDKAASMRQQAASRMRQWYSWDDLAANTLSLCLGLVQPAPDLSVS